MCFVYISKLCGAGNAGEMSVFRLCLILHLYLWVRGVNFCILIILLEDREHAVSNWHPQFLSQKIAYFDTSLPVKVNYPNGRDASIEL